MLQACWHVPYLPALFFCHAVSIYGPLVRDAWTNAHTLVNHAIYDGLDGHSVLQAALGAVGHVLSRPSLGLPL